VDQKGQKGRKEKRAAKAELISGEQTEGKKMSENGSSPPKTTKNKREISKKTDADREARRGHELAAASIWFD